MKKEIENLIKEFLENKGYSVRQVFLDDDIENKDIICYVSKIRLRMEKNEQA